MHAGQEIAGRRGIGGIAVEGQHFRLRQVADRVPAQPDLQVVGHAVGGFTVGGHDEGRAPAGCVPGCQQQARRTAAQAGDPQRALAGFVQGGPQTGDGRFEALAGHLVQQGGMQQAAGAAAGRMRGVAHVTSAFVRRSPAAR
jgi:hypothetical protein